MLQRDPRVEIFLAWLRGYMDAGGADIEMVRKEAEKMAAVPCTPPNFPTYRSPSDAS